MATNRIDFDQLKRPHWNPEQTENARTVLDFVQKIMNDHDFDYILKTYGPHPYVQHNRSMKDGVQGVVHYLQSFVKSFPEFNYDVKSIIVDGDLVSIHSHATIKK